MLILTEIRPVIIYNRDVYITKKHYIIKMNLLKFLNFKVQLI